MALEKIPGVNVVDLNFVAQCTLSQHWQNRNVEFGVFKSSIVWVNLELHQLRVLPHELIEGVLRGRRLIVLRVGS